MRGNQTRFSEVNVDGVYRDTNPSTIIIMRDHHAVLKLVKPRRWVEYFKFFWGRSRLSKEVHGNLQLKKIGIRVPVIFSQCYALNPIGRYLGCLFMEDLEASGAYNFQDLLERDKNIKLREQAILNVIKDLQIMQSHKMVFSDLKLNNIFVDALGEVTWIDTGITFYNFFMKAQFISKNNYSISRFIRIHSNLLSAQEINAFSTLLLK